jgi:hypothetical protein
MMLGRNVNEPDRLGTVSVFGSNDAREGDEAYQTARAVGRRLAEAGCVVANGGYGGTMEASARGAKETGGRTIGVTCSVWQSSANAYIDETVVTDSLMQRVAALVELGKSGYVVLPGATGTLVELAVVWEEMCKGLIARRPLVCVGEFWRPVVEMMSRANQKSADFVSVVPGADDLRRFFPPARMLK